VCALGIFNRIEVCHLDSVSLAEIFVACLLHIMASGQI